MRAKSMVLILIALGCGLAASIAISQILDRGGSDGTAETVPIYVPSTDLDTMSLNYYSSLNKFDLIGQEGCYEIPCLLAGFAARNRGGGGGGDRCGRHLGTRLASSKADLGRGTGGDGEGPDVTVSEGSLVRAVDRDRHFRDHHSDTRHQGSDRILGE